MLNALKELSGAGGSALKKIIVRKFQESDVEDVVEIFSQVGDVRTEEERKRTLEHLKKAAREPRWYDNYLVAELERRVVGRVILEAAYPPYSELINLYVHSNYQGRGVGSSLVQSCIKIASAHKCFVISAMTDPVGNLPAHRLYSKFGFRPGILGDPSAKRGHMWLFRFSEESCVPEFLKRHPFAEPSVASSKVDFQGRMLYCMAWRDPQSEDKLVLYLEGQPSQIPEGTMPRIAGFSYQEKDVGLEALVQEQSKIIRRGETSGFITSLWNIGTKPLQIALSASIPDGTVLALSSQLLPPIEINPKNERTIQFELTWPSSCDLPEFTTFSTVPATCFFQIEDLEQPLFASAGFEKEELA